MAEKDGVDLPVKTIVWFIAIGALVSFSLLLSVPF